VVEIQRDGPTIRKRFEDLRQIRSNHHVGAEPVRGRHKVRRAVRRRRYQKEEPFRVLILFHRERQRRRDNLAAEKVRGCKAERSLTPERTKSYVKM
jgi:hypothetical protein